MLNSIDINKSDHRWGFKDCGFIMKDDKVFFKGDRYPLLKNVTLPYLRPFIEKSLGMSLTQENFNYKKKVNIPKPKLSPTFIKAVKKSFKKDQFSNNDLDRLIHSHGQTTTDEIYKILYQGKLAKFADGVFYPLNESDLEKIIQLAVKYNLCLVPYGGGSNVSSALLIPLLEKRTVLVVDMRKLDAIEWIDEENGLAQIQAGIVGRHLEEKLNKKGYTMGHDPDSIEFSTLGGWISTNASGMKRNLYGNIEDIVLNYTLITPQGKLEEIVPVKKNKKKSWFDRVSTGMQTKSVFFGNEGNLGFVSKAIVKIHPFPEVKKYDSFLFKNIKEGISFLKEIAQQSYKPASIRLVDNQQFQLGYALRLKKKFNQGIIDKLKKILLFKVKKFNPEKMCLATLVFEGSKENTDYQNRQVAQLAKKYQGMRAGSEGGERGYSLTMVIAYIRDFLSDFHCIGETMETTVPWSKVHQVCQAWEKEAKRLHQQYRLPGKVFISYRITQLYHSSVCVYFTIAMYVKGVKNPEDVFAKIEKQLRKKILEEGGSVSHHHGVGKLRKEFLSDIINPSQISLLKEVKKKLDPSNVFGISNNIFHPHKK